MASRLPPIRGKQHIAAPAEAVWALISSPGHLEECHPFCARNPVHRWPGVGSHDTIEYHNGRVVERHFTGWDEGHGYDIDIVDGNGPAAQVSWRLDPSGDGSELAIAVWPRWGEQLAAPVWWALQRTAVRPLMRRYLRAVLRGIEWRVTTERPVAVNQFGGHIWFSR